MDEYTLAQTLLTIAKRDMFDNIGRLLVSDVKYEVQDKTLTAEKILQVWEKYFPNFETDHRSDNVILVFWDGKDTAKNVRGAREPVIPAIQGHGNATSQDKEEETVVEK